MQTSTSGRQADRQAGRHLLSALRAVLLPLVHVCPRGHRLVPSDSYDQICIGYGTYISLNLSDSEEEAESYGKCTGT
jgi:hypothetical protein